MSLDKFIQDGQDPKVVEKIYIKIQDMLTNGESVKYIAMQKKPAVTLLPDCIIISNRRIFLCEFTKLGLSTNFEIFNWKEIKDIAFKEEIFGSKVTVIPTNGENLSIDYIPKTQARKLFQLIKDALETSKLENEDSVVIKTSVSTPKEAPKPIVPFRDIYEPTENKVIVEEIKAIVPPPVVAPAAPIEKPIAEHKVEIEIAHTPIPSPAVTEVEDELTLKLKKLKSLYDKQLITQAEYENKKAEILDQL